ncbi:MAG: response regulator [Deltaproteobacteria bacterium]|nr:response regulator [Deltaproteobacteria bacterium]
MVEERRKSARYPLVLAVTWPEPAPGKDHTEDLSATGLFIRTERVFTKGERIPVELSFPGLLERTRLTVEVVRRREPGHGTPAGLGVAIPPDATAEARRLDALARAAAEAGHGGRPFRVLLVEDNALVATMYASALRRLSAREGIAGLQVETSANGDQALLRLGAMPPVDLVITDVYMPVMDGLKLLERIRQDPKLADLPVVVISSGTSDEDARASELGAQFFLRKPVKYQDIVATVRTLLVASAHRELRAALGSPGGSPPPGRRGDA